AGAVNKTPTDPPLPVPTPLALKFRAVVPELVHPIEPAFRLMLPPPPSAPSGLTLMPVGTPPDVVSTNRVLVVISETAPPCPPVAPLVAFRVKAVPGTIGATVPINDAVDRLRMTIPPLPVPVPLALSTTTLLAADPRILVAIKLIEPPFPTPSTVALNALD